MSGRLASLGSSSCYYKGGQICSGAVTNEIGRKVLKICDDGILKYKPRNLVGDDFPLFGRDTGEGKGILTTFMHQKQDGILLTNCLDCHLLGTVFCNGDLMEVDGKYLSVSKSQFAILTGPRYLVAPFEMQRWGHVQINLTLGRAYRHFKVTK